MTDIINKEVVENNTIVDEKVYKTKDYVRRAINKYRKKKYSEDAEYREKQKDTVIASHQKHIEKYREQSRIYMREYRARKKAEVKEQAPNKDTSVDITTDIHNEKVIEITTEIADKLILHLETKE